MCFLWKKLKGYYKNLKIQQKLTFSHLIIVLIPMLVIGVFFYTSLYDMIHLLLQYIHTRHYCFDDEYICCMPYNVSAHSYTLKHLHLLKYQVPDAYRTDLCDKQLRVA